MVAILGNEVIGIPIILRSNSLDKCSGFIGWHIYPTKGDGASVNETWAAPRFHFKNSTSWELVSSKTVLLTMDCSYTEKDAP